MEAFYALIGSMGSGIAFCLFKAITAGFLGKTGLKEVGLMSLCEPKEKLEEGITGAKEKRL